MGRKKILAKDKEVGRLKGWEKKYMTNLVKYNNIVTTIKEK